MNSISGAESRLRELDKTVKEVVIKRLNSIRTFRPSPSMKEARKELAMLVNNSPSNMPEDKRKQLILAALAKALDMLRDEAEKSKSPQIAELYQNALEIYIRHSAESDSVTNNPDKGNEDD